MTPGMTSQCNFDEIRIFDDSMDTLEIVESIAEAEQSEDPFHIFDIGDVVTRHRNWISKMPRVAPHFAVKCNPNPTAIKVLAALNAGFDCASQDEIRQVMQFGVPGERIIFANPTKLPSHIKFARKVGVDKMTVDCESELLKIKDLFPEAKIVIRIRCDAANSDALLGLKFGCDPDREAIHMIQMTKDLGLRLHGFSFHVGSPCGEMIAYHRGIRICKSLIEAAKAIGCKDVRLIDIGGGIPGETGVEIDEYADSINDALKDVDPSIDVISEPGRYYVTSASTLASLVHSKKIIIEDGRKKLMYYMTDGTYGSFIEELLNLKCRLPVLSNRTPSGETFPSTLWGPTCDSFDCIAKEANLPELEIGDRLVWFDMGAYGVSLSSNFNGFKTPLVYPVIRRSDWESLCNDLKQLGKMGTTTMVTQNGCC
ncbi:ornithine decarboxylase 1 [Orussus abietinus]|uniref:ornithine decarboxylase 1 n=1 Tax=Orussus abietinus TaxID=222816 RepID=UPI0006262413|nr:ornithine decarboxylase 1 [Orussus abietinus]